MWPIGASLGVGSSRLPGLVDESSDPVIRQFREQISDNDRALVEALNKRLRLVARLKDYKESRGRRFRRRRPARSGSSRTWRGPTRARSRRTGLREFYFALFELTKREVSGAAPEESDA